MPTGRTGTRTSCAGYPPDGQWGSVTSATGARLKMPAGSFGCRMLQLAGSIAHQLQLSA
jgi:hypothetical protein